MEQQRIEVVGKLGSTYGIRGWLRIYSSTEQAESIFEYQPWFLKIKGEWQPTELENWRHHNHEIIVKLKGVDDREVAQILEGYTMGTVTEMMETGSNDVLVVKANTKDAFEKQERLIPFLYEQVVKRVDLTTKTIEVDWDAGF